MTRCIKISIYNYRICPKVKRQQKLTDYFEMASVGKTKEKSAEIVVGISKDTHGQPSGSEAHPVTAKEALWLTEKFGDGEYADIPGLCKAATLEEIEAKGFSLTPGAYVGVAPAEDDGVDFHERMAEIHRELRGASGGVRPADGDHLEELGGDGAVSSGES